jgi:hypothetical protein
MCNCLECIGSALRGFAYSIEFLIRSDSKDLKGIVHHECANKNTWGGIGMESHAAENIFFERGIDTAGIHVCVQIIG